MTVKMTGIRFTGRRVAALIGKYKSVIWHTQSTARVSHVNG